MSASDQLSPRVQSETPALEMVSPHAGSPLHLNSPENTLICIPPPNQRGMSPRGF